MASSYSQPQIDLQHHQVYTQDSKSPSSKFNNKNLPVAANPEYHNQVLHAYEQPKVETYSKTVPQLKHQESFNQNVASKTYDQPKVETYAQIPAVQHKQVYTEHSI